MKTMTDFRLIIIGSTIITLGSLFMLVGLASIENNVEITMSNSTGFIGMFVFALIIGGFMIFSGR